MGQKFQMRAPNGAVSVVDSDEMIGQKRAIDVFRQNGAVVIGPVGEAPSAPERPPAPTPIYDASTASNITGTRAEALARAAGGRFGDFNADFGRGIVSSVADMALSADSGIRALTGMGPRDPNSLVGRAAEPPNSWGGTLGKLGGDVASFALGEGELKALAEARKLGKLGTLGAEMAAGAGITGLQTGGDTGAMAAGAAFPVIGAARAAMAPNMVGRAGKLAADAALGYGAGYTLSGGDKDMALAGAIGVPALTGGYATTKALARGAGRIAAGAEEGGLGGALASVVRKVTPQDPWRMITQALKPRNSQINFEKNLPNIAPMVKHVAETAGMPLNTLDEVVAATDYAKKTVRSQFDTAIGNRARVVDATPMADRQLAAIPSMLEEEDPAAWQRAVKRANTWRGKQVSLDKAEDYLEQTNAALESYYQKFPGAQRKALAAKPKVAALEAKAQALREMLYGDNPGLPAPARLLNQRYGQLMEFKETLLRRKNVAARQQPESLSQQIGKVAAVGKGVTGLYQLAHGNPMGLAHIAGAKAMDEAATFLKEQQTTDALLRRAFKLIPGPGERPPIAGLIGTGARPMGPSPDTSYARGVPATPAEPVSRPGQRQLPPGPPTYERQTPLPGEIAGQPDPSYARGVPATPAEVGPRPGQPQLPTSTIADRQTALGPGADPSYVKSIPAEYGKPMDTTLLGIAAPAVSRAIPDDPESQWDDYARAALDVGGAAALGMAAAKGRKTWGPVLEKAFPLRDAYGKLRGFVKPDKFVEMMTAAEGATPEMITETEKLAAKAKGKPMRAKEIINRLMGIKHDPGRILYDMKTVPKGAKPLPGAPRWVTSEEKEAESLGGYLDLVLKGVLGRDFYTASGKAFIEHAGDNPDRAYRLSGAAAITSPSTDVAGNTGHAVKGHNQAISGMPVRTGMFPTQMSKTVKKLYDRVAGTLGPKREPFVRQIAMGGDFASEAQKTNRAVHDFWEGEAFRYVNPDGTPQRKGYSAAEHAWMDKMTDRAIAQANATKLGGFDNWDAGSLQAAAWTGAKVAAGDIKEGAAAQSFADYLKRYYMQTGREVVPGGSTGHLVGLKDNPEALDYYVKEVSKLLYDTKGREKAAMAKDMLVGGSLEGPGIFRGEITPGRQVNQLAGIISKDKKAGSALRRVDPASMALIKANEAEYGMMLGQDAIAGTMPDEGALVAERDMYDLKLPGGQLGMADPALAQAQLQQAIANDRVAAIPTPEGMRVLNLDMSNRLGSRRANMLNAAEVPASKAAETAPRRAAAINAGERSTRMSDLRAAGKSKGFDQFMRSQAEAAGTGGRKGAADVTPARNMGFYEGNQWNTPEGVAAQNYARIILAVPSGEAGFNKSTQAYAKALNEIEAYVSKTWGIHPSETMTKLREAVAAKGMDGVRELAAKAGVPLAVLLALAQGHRLLPAEGGA